MGEVLNANECERLHWTRNPVRRFKALRQPGRPAVKPRGLWYERDGDWRRWCEAEEFARDSFVHAYKIVPTDRVLQLPTVAAVLGFDHEFGVERYTMRVIDWSRVARQWAGVEIAPYQWELRHDERVFWYYGWDCASGCIWHPDGLAAPLRLVRTRETARA